MSLLITTVFRNGFQESYLPAVDNKTVPLTIRPHISGWADDITLPLEVWDGAWSLRDSRQFTITRDEETVEQVGLDRGTLLNCELRGSDEVFSVTVDEVEDGSTRFEKYFHDVGTAPWVSIGSAPGNVVTYGNQFCSPKHAEIVVVDGQTRIRDVGSVNGTFVNGRLLTAERALEYGDVVYVVGLKIVYLGNVLAINNPGGACDVDRARLAPIRIEAGGEPETAAEAAGEETYFLRTPRKLETVDDETISIEKCPPRNEQKKPPILFTIGPAFTMMIPMLAGVMMSSGQGASAAGGVVMAVGAAVIGGMWAILNIRYQDTEDRRSEQTRVTAYTTYVGKIARRIEAKAAANRGVLARMLPSAQEVASFAIDGAPRLWEKSQTHDDFLTVRLGRGTIPSPSTVVVPAEQLGIEHDPLNDTVAELQEATSVLVDVPVGLSLLDNRMVGVVSRDRSRVLELANVICTQLAGLHPYPEVRLCYVYSAQEADDWHYARWLPHTWTPDGTLRMVANDKLTVGDVMYHLSSVIRERLDREPEDDVRVLPHYVVVVADWSLVEDEPIAKYLMNPQPGLGISVVYLVDAVDKLPSACTAIVTDDAEGQGFYSTVGAFPERTGVAFDTMPRELTETFARRLSGFRLRELGTSSAIPDTLTFLDMYRTSRVEDLDLLHRWLENRTYESMKSLVGHKSGNQPLYLDIHEKYHGPHGLVAGTTGSGKSETLQSYILSLAVNYHPHEVAFILIDYKGGGMAQSFLGLPHLSGVITNLGGNATDRALASINAEIKSRQRIFNEYKVKHIDAYIELYRAGVATEPMPHLLIIADEFAELKKEQPEFVRALVSAARVGRSLGVNLILATQKPSGVVDDEIWSNTRFRLCLRVADKQDSAEMIKRPDAAFITGTGRGFFQVGNDEIFEEFQSGWSGAEYEPEVPFSDDKNAKVELITLIGRAGVPKQKKAVKASGATRVTQLDAVVAHAARVAEENEIPAIKQIWLPPLPRVVYLEDLAELPAAPGFSVRLPVGLVDNPDGQEQYPCAVDFLADGHLLVCGASGSGKTTLLQTLLYGAVTRYTPAQVNLYVADFSSRTMAVFASLPQVGGVMFDGDDETIAATFDLLQATLARRKSEFSEQGIGSYREYVTQHDDCPAIIFAIDNYVAFTESYEQYEDVLAQLSREAASYGIFLVLTMNNAGELRSRIRQNITSGIALQMPDRFEYEAVIGDRTEIVPEGRTPGRGLIKAPHPVEVQVALCVREDEGQSQAQTLRRRFAAIEPAAGEGIRKVGQTIDELSLEALLARTDVAALPDNVLALGLDTEDGGLVTVDLDAEFCYTVGGSGGSGKSTLLASIARQAQATGARVFLVDPVGRLADAASFERVVRGTGDLFDLMEQVLVPAFTDRNGIVADTRDAGGDVVAALRDHDRLVVVIDDMRAFVEAVHSPEADMSEFVETALTKGVGHKIQFFAAVTPDDWADLARYAVMRIWAEHRRGVHLGGLFDQQSILRLTLSEAAAVRQLPPGVGYTAGHGDVAIKVITPQVRTEDER